MGKQKGHGRRRYPAVNRLGAESAGKVLQVYDGLFPQDWRALGERVRDFDTRWFEAHPECTSFMRVYIPGEAYPKHDPAWKYTHVGRTPDGFRVRGMATARAQTPDEPFVEVPADLYAYEDEA